MFVFLYSLKGKDGVAVHIYKEFMSRHVTGWNYIYTPIEHPPPKHTLFLFSRRETGIIFYITR